MKKFESFPKHNEEDIGELNEVFYNDSFLDGSENALHELIDDQLNTDFYFCNPYHSWEKGSAENVILV